MAGPTARARWFAVVLAVTVTAYVLCPVATSTDSRWTLYLAMSLLREKDVDLDEYAHLMEDGDFRVVYHDGHIYSYFPVAAPLLVVPYVWVVDRVFPWRFPTDLAGYLLVHFPDSRVSRLEQIAAAIVAACAAGIVYLVVSSRLDTRRALLLTFVFAFGTSMFSTASRALWQHGLSVLCLSAALWILLRPEHSGSRLLMAGALLGISFVVRPTNSISIFILTIYVLLNRRDRLVPYSAGLLIPIALLILYSLRVYGDPLPAYYQPQRLGTNTEFLSAALGNLVSPNRGLFVSSPILILAVAGAYSQFRNGQMSLGHPAPFLAAILVGHWIAISTFDNWYGGWSLGPRLFTDVLPYFIYFLIPVLQAARLSSLGQLRAAFGALLMLSSLVHFRYATSIYPFLWNAKPVAIADAPERVWDVLDLQVLRGFCADKLEGRAPACWLGVGAAR